MKIYKLTKMTEIINLNFMSNSNVYLHDFFDDGFNINYQLFFFI